MTTTADSIVPVAGMIIPIAGMIFAGFAVWNEFQRQRKALDVLKVYAEKGEEPPESVLRLLSRASGRSDGWRRSNPLASAVFFAVLAIGFGALTFWFARGDPRATWVFVTGFGICAFALGAIAASDLVRALTPPRTNEQ